MTQSVSLRVIHTELCQQRVFGWPSGFSGNDWFVSTIIMLVIVALSDISLLSNGSAWDLALPSVGWNIIFSVTFSLAVNAYLGSWIHALKKLMTHHQLRISCRFIGQASEPALFWLIRWDSLMPVAGVYLLCHINFGLVKCSKTVWRRAESR